MQRSGGSGLQMEASERDHYHCPFGDEHPQPFVAGGLLLCGRCYFVDDVLTIMVECSPEVCE